MPIPPPPPPPSSPDTTPSSLTHIMRTTLSYDTNIMLAAIISLLLVILFILFLHLYTRWFLLQARQRSRTSVTVPRVLTSRLHQRFTIIDSDHTTIKLGLPFSTIASLPLFVYNLSQTTCRDYALECAICLSLFEDEEIGRKLPDCGHAFHVECIDMWLHSHSTCPICRRAIQCNRNRNSKIQHLEVGINQINDLENNSNGLTTTTSDQNQIVENGELVVVIGDNEGGIRDTSSFSVEESRVTKNSNCDGGELEV